MPKKSLSPSARVLFSALALISLSHCATAPKQSVKGNTTVVNDGSYWSEKPVMGTAKIVISLDEQLVGLFRGGKIQGLSPISSGMEGYNTSIGNFKVVEKDPEHRSSLYGAFVDDFGRHVIGDVCTRTDTPPPNTHFVGAPMFYFMRFNGAVGMHQGYLPGYPASHGCIRLPAKMASLFYYSTPHGTPVEVRHDAGLVRLYPKVETPSVAATKPTTSTPASVAKAPESAKKQPLRTVRESAAPKRLPASRVTEKPVQTNKKSKNMPRGTTLYWDGS